MTPAMPKGDLNDDPTMTPAIPHDGPDDARSYGSDDGSDDGAVDAGDNELQTSEEELRASAAPPAISARLLLQGLRHRGCQLLQGLVQPWGFC